MNPVKLLIDEHKTIEKMIRLLQSLSKDLPTLERLSSTFFEPIIDFFRIYADQCHHGKEEKILFAKLALKKISEEDHFLMVELIEEHKMGRKLVSALSNTCQTKDIKRIQELLVGLTTLYLAHIDKENRRFFLPAFRYFSNEEIENILEEFFENDRQMIQEKYFQIVLDAEQKRKQLFIS